MNDETTAMGNDPCNDEREQIAALRAEIAQLSEDRREIQSLLEHNPHTGLPVRRVFDRDMEHRLGADPAGVAVGLLRLDNAYSRIRNARDRNRVLLFQTARRIEHVLPGKLYQSDRPDEFLLMITDGRNPDRLMETGRAIVAEVARPHEPPADDLRFGAYLGITRYPADGTTKEDLVANAEIALEESAAKSSSPMLYEAKLGEAFRRRHRLESELKRTIQNGFEGFSILFQPFVDRNEHAVGSEALIRWNHPELGQIPPPQFIPLAEERGDINILGQWTLYNSLSALRRRHLAGYEDLYVSVNLSPAQFRQRDLVERVLGVLKAVQVEPSRLKLELTEGMLMEEPTDAIRKMGEIRSLGVRLSVDDFGTGYSSLAYLRHLPVDTLKIDKSFVDDVHRDRHSWEIVRSIIGLAKAVNLECLAEGVELREQLDLLIEGGCDLIQGYYYSRPLPEHEFSQFLERYGRRTEGKWAMSHPVAVEPADEATPLEPADELEPLESLEPEDLEPIGELIEAIEATEEIDG